MPACLPASSLQSCPTLCDPMDYSPPDTSVHEIPQTRILEWVAMPSSRDLLNPGIEPRSPALQADSLLLSQQRSPRYAYVYIYIYKNWFTQWWRLRSPIDIDMIDTLLALSVSIYTDLLVACFFPSNALGKGECEHTWRKQQQWQAESLSSEYQDKMTRCHELLLITDHSGQYAESCREFTNNAELCSYWGRAAEHPRLGCAGAWRDPPLWQVHYWPL